MSYNNLSLEPLKKATYYKIGVGKEIITYRTHPLTTLGFHDTKPKTKAGKASEDDKKTYQDFDLYARSFVIEHYDDSDESQKIIIIVVADIWACSEKLRDRVLFLISQDSEINPCMEFMGRNIMISCTHNHSGPGGYFNEGHFYDASIQDNQIHKDENFNTIANGIYKSIREAYLKRSKGKIYMNKTDLHIGWNRSIEAYKKNSDEGDHLHNIDPEMLLLKFCKVLGNGEETAIGVLNWFAIHPTDRGKGYVKKGQYNPIHGDNKGFAALMFEKEFLEHNNQNIIAAFANANCGDINGQPISVYGQPVNSPKLDREVAENARLEAMKRNGNAQKRAAQLLFRGEQIPFIELKGPISVAFNNYNFSKIILDKSGKRTWIPTIGFSMLTGSTEGGTSSLTKWPFCFEEGITQEEINKGEINGKENTEMLSGIRAILELTSKQLPINLENYEPSIFQVLGLKFSKFIKTILAHRVKPVNVLSDSEYRGHYPKPIALVVGEATYPLLEEELPLQLFQIGQLAIAGIPAELTTMSGRRLRKALEKELKDKNITQIALSTYSNNYAQYVATFEEYQEQHYEGASTLYGPHTLDAYIQCFNELAEKFTPMA